MTQTLQVVDHDEIIIKYSYRNCFKKEYDRVLFVLSVHSCMGVRLGNTEYIICCHVKYFKYIKTEL